jgi:sugar phosphate isomerase/epimerase
MGIDKLGILTDEVSDDFNDALDWAKANGLPHIEARVIDGTNAANLTDDAARGVRRRVEARGLYVSAIASPLFKCALDPGRPVASGDRFGQAEESVEQHFQKLDRVIAIASLLGTRRIRIFSFWREVQPNLHVAEIVAHLRRAAKTARDADVLLLVENEPACNGGFAAEVAEIVRGVDSPAVRALWDPGNEAYGGREAFPAGYEQMKDVLAHVHLKDAIIGPDGKPRCVPMGSGNVPVIPQLKALKAAGYDGLFTIETHFAPAGSNKKTGSQLTLDAMKTLWKEV